jgi:hypothetical protein
MGAVHRPCSSVILGFRSVFQAEQLTFGSICNIFWPALIDTRTDNLLLHLKIYFSFKRQK